MLRVRLFDGVESELVVYNGQAVVDLEIQFFTEECDDDLEYEEEDFTFPGYASSYLRVYNERLGKEIKDISLSQSGSSLVVNASVADMTFDENGKYYYEIGYVNVVYDQVLKFGKLTVK
jgi:hypothetical protein